MAIFPGQPTVPLDQVGVSLAPFEGGVYAICAADGRYLYFGETNDVRRRLMEHLDDTNGCVLRAGGVFFAYEIYPSYGTRVARRDKLIAMYLPPCN
jgi:GIY-YIG catalytic domain-containing protein